MSCKMRSSREDFLLVWFVLTLKSNSFHLFSSFCTVQLLKNFGASGIRTRIVGAVGENADHYTTTTALLSKTIQTLLGISCAT